ncbi:MAG: transcription antitermination factor NusB [Blautia sp.]|nr:transcription antitermination factor NusB [Blautia sp.]
MRRSELREHIFKLLFISEFNPSREMPSQLDLYLEDIPDLSEKDRDYMVGKFSKVRENLTDIDALLNEVSRGWKTRRMNRVDLAALRLAVYEVRYDEDVPTGVAINEAVELSKRYGGDDSGSFVNGILGRVARMKDAPESPEEADKNESE